MRINLLFIIPFILFLGCTTPSKKYGSPLKVSSDFVGVWAPTQTCSVPKEPGLSGDVTIRKAKDLDHLEIITATQIEPQPFNANFDLEYKDYANIPFNVRGSIEVFQDGKTVSSATIWHPRAEKDKGVGVILKTYELNDKGQLTFHKYGYVSVREKGQFKVYRYGDLVPHDYRCVYEKKK